MVIVNIYRDDIPSNDNSFNNPILTINIPFNSDKLDINDVIYKINKIIKVASSNCYGMTSSDFIKFLDLDDDMQLSVTESSLVKLTSNGYSINDISMILSRSEKTILCYRRSVIKKLGVLNKLDFYNYASYMKVHGNENAIFICI